MFEKFNKIHLNYSNKNLVNSKQFPAFTLAEVLITLGIIGIIASMTIPTLVSKVQNQEYVAGLKKFYTTSNQALNLMIKDYGCVGDLACTGLLQPSHTSTIPDFNLAYSKYFKIAKTCGYDTPGCFTTKTISRYDGSGTEIYNFNTYGNAYHCYTFITSDGMSVALSPADLVEGNHSSGKTGNLKQLYGYIFVDVNGLKGPNYVGRDTFEFCITNGKGALIYPGGGSDTLSWWRTDSGNPVYCYPGNPIGFECAARIMEEGWQMNY